MTAGGQVALTRRLCQVIRAHHQLLLLLTISEPNVHSFPRFSFPTTAWLMKNFAHRPSSYPFLVAITVQVVARTGRRRLVVGRQNRPPSIPGHHNWPPFAVVDGRSLVNCWAQSIESPLKLSKLAPAPRLLTINAHLCLRNAPSC